MSKGLIRSFPDIQLSRIDWMMDTVQVLIINFNKRTLEFFRAFNVTTMRCVPEERAATASSWPAATVYQVWDAEDAMYDVSNHR